MPQPPLNLGLIGLGTVGTGVAKILTEHAERMTRHAGREIRLRKVVVRDKSKQRGIDLPAELITDDVSEVIADPSIDLAVQLIGGLSPAREIMLDLLAAGKDVVTANKALLCEHGDGIFQQAREQNRTIAFEAAVAGGIPIISTLTRSLTANQVLSIEAILNGTSNFILTKMLAEGRNYGDVLGEAQELGYAEADPTMDIDGTDAAQKLVILTQLAFGTKVPLEEFPRQGIDVLNLADLQYAAELGYVVKLLAVSKLIDGQLAMMVQPTLIREDRPLAKVDGAFNMIALDGDAVGTTWYSGAGAGQMATASAVVADIIDMAVGRAQIGFRLLDIWSKREPVEIQPIEKAVHRYYLRFNVIDRPHVIADITHILGTNGISLASVIQHEAPEWEEESASSSFVPLVVMTHRTTEGRMQEAERELNQLEAVQSPFVRMIVAD